MPTPPLPSDDLFAGAAEGSQQDPPNRSRRASTAQSGAEQLELEFVRFGPRDRPLDLRVDVGSDTIWATEADMTELFGVGTAAVSREIATLKAEGGLGAVRPGGAGTGDLHDLDTILCVG